MIYCIGNTNYDIVFEDGKIVGGYPGGSMLNAAVSLGRMGASVQFVTTFGDDLMAKNIRTFLQNQEVKTDFVNQLPGKKSGVAIAMLDKEKKPSYSFYGDRDLVAAYHTPTFCSKDIVLFGSSYAVQKKTASVVSDFLEEAISQEALVIYDPNIRKKKCADAIGFTRNKAEECIHKADIIKCSDEDLEVMGWSIAELREKYPQKTVFYTMGEKGVEMYINEEKIYCEAQEIDPVSTIGAGDGFNAGIVLALTEKQVRKNKLRGVSRKQWLEIMHSGVAAASEVCLSNENYVNKRQ